MKRGDPSKGPQDDQMCALHSLRPKGTRTKVTVLLGWESYWSCALLCHLNNHQPSLLIIRRSHNAWSIKKEAVWLEQMLNRANMATSYKAFWFKGILEEVYETGGHQITFDKIVCQTNNLLIYQLIDTQASFCWSVNKKTPWLTGAKSARKIAGASV